MSVSVMFLGREPVDESGSQRALREVIRRARAGLPSTAPTRKLYEDDFIDLTDPRGGTT